MRRMALAAVRPFSLHRDRLSHPLGLLRLIFMCAAALSALLFFSTVFGRLALNGGRVFYSDEVHSLWPAVLPWPAISIPAWLMVALALIGCVSAGIYLLTGGLEVRDDIPYIVTVSVIVFAILTPVMSIFDPDPSGVAPFNAPHPIGWHWLAGPLVLLVIVSAIICAVRTRHAERDVLARLRATRAAYLSEQEER